MKPKIMGFYEPSIDLMNNRVSSETERNRSLPVGLHANQARTKGLHEIFVIDKSQSVVFLATECNCC